LLAAGRGFVHIREDGTARTLTEVAPAGTMMNDRASDPQGRFWAGTMADDDHAGTGRSIRTNHADDR
jgi:sugar lactone lactonase YvrE